jgi:uncharacterized membrane protein
MDETLILVTFGDDSHAFEALAEVKALGTSGRLDLREAGVVRRSDTGRLSLADHSARHRRDGSAAGGLVGALVGILGGPVGVLVGGAAGILAGGVHDGGDAEDTDDVLARIAHDIPSGSTALVADVGEYGFEVVDSAMRGLGGSTARYARKDVEAEVTAVDEAARKST